MTHEELQAIKARADAATPGPWTARLVPSCGCGQCSPHTNIYLGDVNDWNAIQLPRVPHESAEFIAHARADVPALAEEVERLRGALSEAARSLDNPTWIQDVLDAKTMT